MWEAVRPPWAAMSREIGTGAVSLGAGEFFSVRAGGLLPVRTGGPWGVLWANSRPVKAIHKIIICPARMHSDCSAIGRSAAVSAAVLRGPSPPRRGRDALGTAGRMPALLDQRWSGYWNEYPLASFPDMNLVLYSSK